MEEESKPQSQPSRRPAGVGTPTSAQGGSSEQPQPEPPKQGMSSGAKWGIGLGGCCCCVIIAVILLFILSFAGCSILGGLRGFMPFAPTPDFSEMPIPSFSSTPR